MFFDEEMLLDLRLNIMNDFVDRFVVTEATYMHNGKPKKLNFDINKFSKFKDKIIYIVVNNQPPDLYKLNDNDKDEKDTWGQKLVLNGYKRDNFQRQIEKWLTPESEKELMKSQCLKRKLVPADVARAVLFFSSNESSACTNQSYIVDGGWI